MPVRAGIGAFFSPLSKICFSLGDFLLQLIWIIKNPADLSASRVWKVCLLSYYLPTSLSLLASGI
jgi:hypothetical protein